MLNRLSIFLVSLSVATSFTVPVAFQHHHATTASSSASWPLFSAVSDTATTTTPPTTTTTKTVVTRPVIHWTVMGFKIGWQDDDGNWFDADGPRNGPPLNYWRQMSDERSYKTDLELVDKVLSSEQVDDIETTILSMEERNSIRRPALSRKLLGEWAPLWSNGVCVSTKKDDTSIETPCTVRVSRTQGRRLAPKIMYGTFNLKLTAGEEITLETSSSSHTLAVDATNPRYTLPADMSSLLGGFGNITYLSEYVLVMRGEDDKIDVWMRADDSHLPEEMKEGYVAPVKDDKDVSSK